MAHASTGFDEPITSINVTPLVDVSLVLVIVFMVTMPFLMERALKIKSADQPVVQASSMEDPILVEFGARGLTVEGRGVALRELGPMVKRLAAERHVNRAALKSEARMPHGRVVEVLDALGDSGADVSMVDPS